MSVLLCKTWTLKMKAIQSFRMMAITFLMILLHRRRLEYSGRNVIIIYSICLIDVRLKHTFKI
jgi:hypothetical protein